MPELAKKVLARLRQEREGDQVVTPLPSSADEVGDSPLEPASSVDQQEQGPPPESPPPPSSEEVAALPLDTFAGRSLMLRVWSRLLDAQIWFVSGEVQVRTLRKQGIPRGEIFTARELIDLLKVFELSEEKGRLVLEAKKLFKGSMRLEEAPLATPPGRLADPELEEQRGVRP